MKLICPICHKTFTSFAQYMRGNHMRCLAIIAAMRKRGAP